MLYSGDAYIEFSIFLILMKFVSFSEKTGTTNMLYTVEPHFYNCCTKNMGSFILFDAITGQ